MPGYVAPADTIGPASRTTTLLIRILADLQAQGGVAQPQKVGRLVRAALKSVIGEDLIIDREKASAAGVE